MSENNNRCAGRALDAINSLISVVGALASCAAADILDSIAAETEAMIDETMPWPYRPDLTGNDDPRRGYTWETPVVSRASGYIRFLDTKRLVELATPIRSKSMFCAASDISFRLAYRSCCFRKATACHPKHTNSCSVLSTLVQHEPCSRTLSLEFYRLSISR